MKKLILPLLILVLGLWITLFFINHKSNMIGATKDITVIAHRGASAYEPENSILSVKKAIELGADMIEIDVQRTKDSVVVVLHDKSIDRTTTGEGVCKNLTYDEISSHHIVDNKGQTTQLIIPTFDEVLSAIDGKVNLLIEIKESSDYYPEIEQQVIDLIYKHNALEWCVIQSFHDDVLETAHLLEPGIEIQKLFYGNLLGIGLKRKSLNQYSYVSSFNGFYPGISKSFVRKVHAMHKKVSVWTINNKKQII